MANMTNWLEENILNSVFHGDATTWIPSGVYLAIADSDADVDELEAGTESEGAFNHEITDYTGDRPQLYLTTVVQEDGKATLENEEEILFENMQISAVQYLLVCDSETKEDGNVLYWGEMSPVVNTGPAETLRIPAGGISITLD